MRDGFVEIGTTCISHPLAAAGSLWIDFRARAYRLRSVSTGSRVGMRGPGGLRVYHERSCSEGNESPLKVGSKPDNLVVKLLMNRLFSECDGLDAGCGFSFGLG